MGMLLMMYVYIYIFEAGVDVYDVYSPLMGIGMHWIWCVFFEDWVM